MAGMRGGPKRIAVVGRAGAGKTTVALQLGRLLDLPVVHLDALYWTRDWKEVGRAEFERHQQLAIDAPSWIIDGGYLSSSGWQSRRDRADLVIVVEAPLVVCLWRVIRRSFERGNRPDRPQGGGEQLSPYFLWWIATWSRRHPNLPETIRQTGKDVLEVRRLADIAWLGAG